MSEQAKQSMMLCEELQPAEQEKVDRLDSQIFTRFISAGLVVRICRGAGSGDDRVLVFCGPTGEVAQVRASDFLSAPDREAVAIIALPTS